MPRDIESVFLGNTVYVNDDGGDGVTITAGAPLFDNGRMCEQKPVQDIFLSEEVLARLLSYLQRRSLAIYEDEQARKR
jgi:hypothetical protein